ncbi:hypothetical protein XI07_13775 [Bradyrhizobium sp. CCBAU 11445]|uniref:hypothetical protein n=1 Tax=Bradyrhizobium sp. CCBAU 11445 TaxID=1630896 RepID=UPI002306D385|nr:hypothetical protein [Bradyrhizobium sp. CCBAU 11445]MDA9483076.1 hypothetical protein [Bradyrhizobium sp. CCBAU 11445]
MTFTLNEAFRVLRARGVTEMKVSLPENEIVEGPADGWAYYSYGKEFYFCVDADGSVVGGREAFEKKVSLLKPRKRTAVRANSRS